jgi:uncharacterized NAD(P)/FAD-binding protein YdhS
LNIPTNAGVGILGSSLSAIDTVMTLADNHHSGSITLYSPDGLLPRVQPNGEGQYERKYLTLKNIHELKRINLEPPKIKDLFKLFKKEAERYAHQAIDWDETGRKGKSAEKLLLSDIKISEAGGDAFINILYSLRHDASTIWSWLSVAEKQKFMRWLGLYWNINRHSMPLVNASRLKELFNKGQLKVKPKLREVKYSSDDKLFTLIHENNQQDQVPYLVNATGPAHDVEKMNSALIKNLINQGIIEPYEVGGICINPITFQVFSSKIETENLFAVGHICNGILLDVNAVWYNVKIIDIMCSYIIQKITRGACT